MASLVDIISPGNGKNSHLFHDEHNVIDIAKCLSQSCCSNACQLPSREETPHQLWEVLGAMTRHSCAIFTPRAHARARGYVIGRGVYILFISLHFFLEPNFYLPKYSLLEVYSNTDRLLIEFNGLWYSLAAQQVFVAIANPDRLLFG